MFTFRMADDKDTKKRAGGGKLYVPERDEFIETFIHWILNGRIIDRRQKCTNVLLYAYEIIILPIWSIQMYHNLFFQLLWMKAMSG